MDFFEAQTWIQGVPEPPHWELDRMRRLVADAGLPLDRLNAIQVAGTNGKGSTCAFLAAMFQHAGLKTGQYTSPHLLDMRERIQINGHLVSKDKFAALATWAKPLVQTHAASQFEALTLMAFKHFLDEGVDWAVVEVGLGGAKDATSVLTPKLALITQVAMDHADKLGNSLKQIAEEKAGIIPENGVCLTTAEGEALDAIEKVGKKQNARITRVKPLPIENETPLLVRLENQTVPMALQGRFQAQNAALAVAAARELREQGIAITNDDIAFGLTHAHWPGRMQQIGNVVIDGAHNPDGIKALATALKAAHPDTRWSVVFGVLADKDYVGMVQELRKLPMKRVVLVTPKSPRALSAEKLQNVVKKEKITTSIEVASSVADALQSLKGRPVLVCGSLYVAAEALNVRMVE